MDLSRIEILRRLLSFDDEADTSTGYVGLSEQNVREIEDIDEFEEIICDFFVKQKGYECEFQYSTEHFPLTYQFIDFRLTSDKKDVYFYRNYYIWADVDIRESAKELIDEFLFVLSDIAETTDMEVLGNLCGGSRGFFRYEESKDKQPLLHIQKDCREFLKSIGR